ncbi:unnamed protein product [Caenorhabditis brenneri]
MPRKSTVAPAICIIEPTITSNTTERPEVKEKKPDSRCMRNCKKITRTLFLIFALTAFGLAFNYIVEHFIHYK